jgi:hypothetical protein
MVNPACLVESAPLAGAAAQLYVSPGATVTILKKLTLVNTDSLNAHLVTLYLVAAGSVAGAGNLLLDQKSVGPLQTLDVTEAVNQVLQTGDFISAFADVAALVNIRISGVQIS